MILSAIFLLPELPFFLMILPGCESMKVYINGVQHAVVDSTTIASLQQKYCPGSDVTIVNCLTAADSTRLICEGDHLYFLKKGAATDPGDLESLIFTRQPEAITRRLKASCVGIAGAGGLGSVVAENLARSGVGKLVIADFDIVEPSNLNRQRYCLAQLGMPKVKALADTIRGFNPFVSVVELQERVTFNNSATLFQRCDIVAECLDSAADKALIVSGILKHLPQAIIVAASGLAGIGDGSAIKTRKIFNRLYLVGDLISDAYDGAGLFASRVGIAASQQSHVIIRLLAGEDI
jgi:sulfur carrier protein ThiS adenylyltransferase